MMCISRVRWRPFSRPNRHRPHRPHRQCHRSTPSPIIIITTIIRASTSQACPNIPISQSGSDAFCSRKHRCMSWRSASSYKSIWVRRSANIWPMDSIWRPHKSKSGSRITATRPRRRARKRTARLSNTTWTLTAKTSICTVHLYRVYVL